MMAEFLGTTKLVDIAKIRQIKEQEIEIWKD